MFKLSTQGIVVLVLVLSVNVQAISYQVVKNPYFTEWSEGKPVDWCVIGNPDVWFTDSFSDSKHTISMGSRVQTKEGDGLMQRVSLQKGQRYLLQCFTGVPKGGRVEVIIKDIKTGKILLQRTGTKYWPEKHSGFFTAKGSQAEVIIRVVKGSHLWVDKVTITLMQPNPTPSMVSIPKIPVYYSSWDPQWLDVLKAVNVIDSEIPDVRTFAKLRKRGVLVLSRVSVINRGRKIKNADDFKKQCDELVAQWISPFIDTKEGAIPGGADGIVIDELEPFDNDAPRLALWEKALGRVRRLFPNKVIAVWGSGSIGSAPGSKHSRVMKMLDTYADLFMLEIYQATCPKSQRSYGRNLSEYPIAARVIAHTSPNLISKTVVVLVTAENVMMNFDISPYHNMVKWLKVQLTNIPRLGREKFGFAGIGQWVSYRAQTTTLIAFEKYVKEIFLADTKPIPLKDDDARNALLEPSFEHTNSKVWKIDGAKSSCRYAAYKEHKSIPPLHDKKVEHGGYFIKMTRKNTPVAIYQDVKVQSGKSYQISVYTLPLSSRAIGEIKVSAGNKILAKATGKMCGPTKWWVRLACTFTVPEDQSAVRIEFNDNGCNVGESLAYDWVDLTPMEGLNRPMKILSIPRVSFGKLPYEITVVGENFLPKCNVRIGDDIYCRVKFVSPNEIKVLIPQLIRRDKYTITFSRNDWLGDTQPIVIENGLIVK